MSKKLVSMLLVIAMIGSMGISVFADDTLGVVTVEDGTEVQAGVYINDEDVRIRVTVPTLFAFVAVGTTTTTNTDALSVSGGTILVPNYTVDVIDETINNGDYSLNMTSSSALQFVNYSTKSDTGTASGRAGVGISLSGSITNTGTAESRNYWEHTSSITAGTTGNTSEFKKYLLTVNGNDFSIADAGGKYTMDGSIALGAPSASAAGSVTAGLLANTGTTVSASFDVQVGGQRGQYSQVEESAKVGTIVWTASYTVVNDGTIETAPSNSYLAP